jgi:hypothetical protein
VQYSLELVNGINGQVSLQEGQFTYVRSSVAASVADFISKFASYLARYHDVEATAITATTMTLRSVYWGFTPNLTFKNILTAANVQTAATVPSNLFAGDLVIVTPSVNGYLVTPFRSANITATSMLGLTLAGMENKIRDGRDQVYDILVSGYGSALCGGTVAKTAGTASINAFTDGNRPGMLNFGGFSHGATTSVTIGTSNNSGTPLAPVNISRQIKAITTNVLPGHVFEVQMLGL